MLILASITVPLALLSTWGVAFVLTRNKHLLQAGHESVHTHSLSEAIASNLHNWSHITQKLIVEKFYKLLFRLLAWFVPKFRSWTSGIETRLMKLVRDIRGKRELPKRDPANTSEFLKDIREHAEVSRKDVGDGRGAIHE